MFSLLELFFVSSLFRVRVQGNKNENVFVAKVIFHFQFSYWFRVQGIQNKHVLW